MSERVQLYDKRFKPLISHDRIQEAVKRLGAEVSADYDRTKGQTNDNPLVFVIVLKGSIVFATDLIRAVTVPCTVEFLKAESYHGGLQSSGKVHITTLGELNLAGKHVVVLEDIIDTGLTLKEILAYLQHLHPASIKIATLLLKPDICKDTVKADYVGFEISPLFVVGYGLDYDEIGRNLPDVYVLAEE
jgi:hypoxanthine phosphoribosyltransferase